MDPGRRGYRTGSKPRKYPDRNLARFRNRTEEIAIVLCDTTVSTKRVGYEGKQAKHMVRGHACLFSPMAFMARAHVAVSFVQARPATSGGRRSLLARVHYFPLEFQICTLWRSKLLS